jgi:hypothetical protein
MEKYGEAAVEAAKLLISKTVAELAWNIVTSDIFGKNTASQKKVVQREHFWVYVNMA